MSHVITAIGHSVLGATENGAISEVLKSSPVVVSSFKLLSRDKATDFFVDIHANTDIVELRNKLKTAVPNVDLILQENTDFRKEKGLIVFDMDSTLIQQEVIEMIAAQANVEDKVAEITTRAMNGELDFKQSLSERVALLKGIHSQTLWDDLKPQLSFTPGVRELCKFMKSKGCKLAVCSGGFLPLAEYVKEELRLDYAFANLLKTEIVGDVEILSGETIGDIVDGERKRDLLVRLAAENGVDLRNTVAVGDGANDLLMMEKSGFGVAWNAKPTVQLKAPACLNSKSLKDVLYMFGYSDIDIN